MSNTPHVFQPQHNLRKPHPWLSVKVVFSYKVFQHNSNSVHIYQIQFLCHTITSQGHCSITFRVVKDKLNLNHSRRHITRIFPRRPILVVANITASSLLKLHIQEFLQPDNSHIFAIRKKVIYRSAGSFQLSGWRRYLFWMKHIHHFSQACSCHIEIKNHWYDIRFILVDFKCPVADQLKTIWYSHALFLLKAKIPMCYPIQEIKHRNIDYFIFSRAVILHSLQVKFVCSPC